MTKRKLVKEVVNEYLNGGKTTKNMIKKHWLHRPMTPKEIDMITIISGIGFVIFMYWLFSISSV